MRYLGFLAVFAGMVGSALGQAVLEVSGLPDDAPVAIRAAATTELLVVDLALEPEWHAYAIDKGEGQPITLRIDGDCAFVAAGGLRIEPSDAGVLTGDVRLELPLVAQRGAEKIRATLEFMVCDALQCLPPMSVAIRGSVAAGPAANSVLLVADQVDERSARIEKFLGERGFDVTVTTYEKVTATDCDRVAVVLADSKLFGQGAKVRQLVLKFPQTVSPIVAVGFHGTELVEAHQIAMTSGYI